MPYVATLSTGPYLLLEGALPTAILYPKRRGLNNRGGLRSGGPRGSLLRACARVGKGLKGLFYVRMYVRMAEDRDAAQDIKGTKITIRQMRLPHIQPYSS